MDFLTGRSLGAIVFLLILSTNISSSSFSLSTSYAFPEDIAINVEQILPDGISSSEIDRFELVKRGEASNIYAIHTKDGKTFYQVVSIVIVRAMPLVVKYACIAAIQNLPFCSQVYNIANVIVNIYGSSIAEKISQNWTARIDGQSGVGSLTTDSLDKAKKGQTAFEVSRDNANIPWKAPVLRPFRSWN